MNMPVGRYVPGGSAVHRADPRSKLIVLLVAMIILFMVDGWLALGCFVALVVALFALARIPARFLFAMLKPVLWLAAFTLLINSFTWQGGLVFTLSGFTRGSFFVVRLFCIMAYTALLTLTTAPIALTDGLARLMRPLSRIGLPVEDIAMMFSIGLRFIPVIGDQTERIMLAQRSRGARFDEGGLIKRAKAWIPVIIPLLVGLFRNADELALAMDARAYTGRGRTHLRELHMTAGDITLIQVSIVALALCILAKIKGWIA